jgi:hypothetical protein
MSVEVHVDGQSVPHRRLQSDDTKCRCHGHRGGIGGGHEQSSPEIRYAGKSFLPSRHTGSGVTAHFEASGIGPGGTRRQRGSDLLHLRGIRADLRARGATDAGSPLNHCPEHGV